MNKNQNADLLRIYKKEIENLSSTDNFSIQPAHPFLLSIPNDYNKKIKVMIIGQETNGWLEDLNFEPQNAMQRYERFWINKKSKYSKKGTFQQVLNKFQDILNKDKVSCVWNNIIKIGKERDLGTPPEYLINWQENYLFRAYRLNNKILLAFNNLSESDIATVKIKLNNLAENNWLITDPVSKAPLLNAKNHIWTSEQLASGITLTIPAATLKMLEIKPATEKNRDSE